MTGSDTLTAPKNGILSAFEQQDFSFDADFSKGVRQKAKETLETLSFPTSKTEYWKYTRVNKIVRGNFSPKFPERSEISKPLVYEKFSLVFVNGYFIPELSNIEKNDGLNISSLSEAKEKGGMIQENFNSLVNEGDIFAQINSAYHQDGAFIHLEKNTVIEEPIHLLYFIDGKEVMANPRNFIFLEEGSQAKVLIKTTTQDQNESSFVNMQTEVFVNENAHLEINKIQDEGLSSFQIANEEVRQLRDSHFKINTFTLSGALVRNNLNIALRGQHTETYLNGLYPLKGKQHVDNHTYVLHREPNCESHELYKGILDEASTGVFNGKVFVHQDAQKTNAYQSNANIVLTDTAKINSKPELEIYADDVKCSHGSTTGQLDEEALFYLRARGLSKASARAVLVNAFAADIIEHIGIESVKEEVEDFIDTNYKGIQ